MVPIIKLATLAGLMSASCRSVRIASSIPVVTSVPVIALYEVITALGPDFVGSRRTASVLVPAWYDVNRFTSTLTCGSWSSYHQRRLRQRILDCSSFRKYSQTPRKGCSLSVAMFEDSRRSTSQLARRLRLSERTTVLIHRVERLRYRKSPATMGMKALLSIRMLS